MAMSCALEKSSAAPSQTVLITPPKKLNMASYRCDNKFHLDHILEMYESEQKIGICLISGKEVFIYVLSISGSHIDYKLVKKADIFLANKHNKGGQSSNRFGRIVQIVRNNYVDIIADHIANTYMIKNNTQCMVSHIILAGNGQMKTDVAKSQIFEQYLSKYLYKIISIDSFDEKTIYEISQPIISDLKILDCKNTDAELNNLIEHDYDNLSFGKSECIELIKTNNVKKLFIEKSEYSNPENQIEKLLCEILNNTKTDIVIVDSHTLKIYGNWIGVKYY